jgi:hypothetical protein
LVIFKWVQGPLKDFFYILYRKECGQTFWNAFVYSDDLACHLMKIL